MAPLSLAIRLAEAARVAEASERTASASIVYVHLFPDDDASEDMAALGAMATGPKPTHGCFGVFGPNRDTRGQAGVPHAVEFKAQSCRATTTDEVH